MPRWKALPEELDPEIREFAGQMRQLVDRGGLSLAAVSDKTGYSKTSWERYLNGRLLPPQGAVSALAEVTGTDVRHLATMWELAERAWSRAEMRHDMTMEAIRISQAREALAKAGEAGGRKRSWAAKQGRSAKGKPVSVAKPAPSAPAPAPPAGKREDAKAAWPSLQAPASTGSPTPRAEPTVRLPRTPGAAESRSAEGGSASSERPEAGGAVGDREGERGNSASDLTELAELAGRSEADEAGGGPLSMARTGPADLRKRPGRPAWPDGWPTPEGSGSGRDAGDPGARQATGSGQARPEWSARLSGVPAPPPEGFESTTVLRRQSAGRQGAEASRPAAAHTGSDTSGLGAGRTAPPPGPSAPAVAGSGGKPPSRGRRMGMVAAGALGALAVIGAAVFLLDMRGGDPAEPQASASPTQDRPELPEGVKCTGKDCAGEDPELMGCGGQYAETTSDAVVGNAYVEVRYSEVCQAAWARIGTATPGTTVTIESAGESENDEVGGDSNSAYTGMVAARTAEAARACVVTAGGMTGCTTPTP